MFENDVKDANTQKPPVDAPSGGCVAARAAAGMLERAARQHAADLPEKGEFGRLKLYLDSVEGLAGDIGRDLAPLSEVSEGAEVPAAALVSAALRGADLATLAACALPELPSGSPAYLRVEASTRLAAAATRSLALEHRALTSSGTSAEPGDYETRDLRGAEWRADLAARQVEGITQEDS